jgi:hypothetical protein
MVPARPTCPHCAGSKGRPGDPPTPHLGPIVHAGSPTRVRGLKALTWRGTEPPEDPRWACHGASSRSVTDRTGTGRSRVVTPLNAVRPGGRGVAGIGLPGRRTRGGADATRHRAEAMGRTTAARQTGPTEQWLLSAPGESRWLASGLGQDPRERGCHHHRRGGRHQGRLLHGTRSQEHRTPQRGPLSLSTRAQSLHPQDPWAATPARPAVGGRPTRPRSGQKPAGADRCTELRGAIAWIAPPPRLPHRAPSSRARGRGQGVTRGGPPELLRHHGARPPEHVVGEAHR